jgi:hypothetical protein
MRPRARDAGEFGRHAIEQLEHERRVIRSGLSRRLDDDEVILALPDEGFELAGAPRGVLRGDVGMVVLFQKRGGDLSGPKKTCERSASRDTRDYDYSRRMKASGRRTSAPNGRAIFVSSSISSGP